MEAKGVEICRAYGQLRKRYVDSHSKALNGVRKVSKELPQFFQTIQLIVRRPSWVINSEKRTISDYDPIVGAKVDPRVGQAGSTPG